MKTRAPARKSSRGTRPRQTAHRNSTRAAKAATRLAASRRSATRGRSSARFTTDHDEIQKWAEERSGRPATVRSSAPNKKGAGILRIDFPGFRGHRSLKPVSWEEWFDIFEERRLGFLHQDRTANGKPSRFNKLVCRE